MFIRPEELQIRLESLSTFFDDDLAFDHLLSSADYSFEIDDAEPDEPAEYVSDLHNLVNDANGTPIMVMEFKGNWIYWVSESTSRVMKIIDSIIDGTYVVPEDWGKAEELEDADGDTDSDSDDNTFAQD